MIHIYLEEEFHKEEKVLYPRADAILPAKTAERLRTFLAAAELPEGWVCVKARPLARDAGR